MADFTLPARSETWLQILSRHLIKGMDKIEQGNGVAGGDIEAFPGDGFSGSSDALRSRFSHIFNINKISCLEPVSQNFRFQPLAHMMAKASNHAGVTRIMGLAGTIDVEESKGDRQQPI